MKGEDGGQGQDDESTRTTPSCSTSATGSNATRATQNYDRLAFDPVAYACLRDQALFHEAVQQLRMAVANRGLKKSAKKRDRTLRKNERVYKTPIHRQNVEQLEQQEAEASKVLTKLYEQVAPAGVIAWQRRTHNVGAHSLAKFLGYLGHPRIAVPYQLVAVPSPGHVCEVGRCARGKHLVAQPPFLRTVAQLWAYCGVGDPARTPRSGMGQEEMLALGNPMLKKLLWRLASQQVKVAVANQRTKPTDFTQRLDEPAANHLSHEVQEEDVGGGYRSIYDERRAAYATRTHARPCIRCGSGKKPAGVGSSWKKGHQHGAAVRFVAKRMLRDIWIAAG